MAKVKKHGGARDGAGRPPVNPEGSTVKLAATVPATLVERLEGMAEANGWSLSEAVTRAIRAFVAKR